jgi:hypothetical protein
MNDIKDLLDQAVRSVGVAPSEEIVEADVLRGRAALDRRRRRRRIRSSVIGAVTATVVVVASIAIGNLDNGESPITATGVQLVAYTGEQLDGFIVDRIPEGWYLQGSSPFALTIAPDGTANTHPDNFMGKLVVMLFSQDMKQQLPEGEPVEVGGHDGVVRRTEEGATLSYEDVEGHFVEVQSPTVLGWTNDQLARFAEGVQVTADAQQTRG